MKHLLLAAAALLATPVIAQTTTGTATPDAATPATPADAQTTPATPADSANPPGTTSHPGGDMPMAQAGAPTTAGGDPVGGYQPSAPAMTGTMTPGVTPVFRAAPSPDQAYPAPAPLAKYPVCKKGQFDKCIQGPSSTHSREVRGRPSR